MQQKSGRVSVASLGPPTLNVPNYTDFEEKLVISVEVGNSKQN